MVTVTVCYVLVNVAYYTVMSADDLLMSDAVALVSGKSIELTYVRSSMRLEFVCGY